MKKVKNKVVPPKYPKTISRTDMLNRMFVLSRQQYFRAKQREGYLIFYAKKWYKASTGLILLNLLLVATEYYWAAGVGVLINAYTLAQFKVAREFSIFSQALDAFAFEEKQGVHHAQ